LFGVNQFQGWEQLANAAALAGQQGKQAAHIPGRGC
jgi:hypothetical protein